MEYQQGRHKIRVPHQHKNGATIQWLVKSAGWLILLAALFVLAACGESGPAATPTLAATPSSTLTPTLTPTPVPVPGPQEVTDAYLAVFNAGDVEAIGDIYTDDVVFSLGNEPFGPGGQPITNSYTGKVAVIGNILQSIADNTKITLSNTSMC